VVAAVQAGMTKLRRDDWQCEQGWGVTIDNVNGAEARWLIVWTWPGHGDWPCGQGWPVYVPVSEKNWYFYVRRWSACLYWFASLLTCLRCLHWGTWGSAPLVCAAAVACMITGSCSAAGTLPSLCHTCQRATALRPYRGLFFWWIPKRGRALSSTCCSMVTCRAATVHCMVHRF